MKILVILICPLLVLKINLASGGVHTLQQMYDCQWDDETGATDGYSQFGYDGADFTILDLKNTDWVAATSQAEIIKQKWNGEQGDRRSPASNCTAFPAPVADAPFLLPRRSPTERQRITSATAC
ncbi:H-2 class I histocompatibility antigen, L-D alpha chain-like [Denticeps clupeoides]|uniref:H-2 class I histocompatibility antigen, L-D alpha chain-like n=1 Tax=Denticeps clupeoides TaxID=299321 RepID=UPI0010A52A4C|nr:H-2 class I histocompatibility antigen, L-D alpha chain-like [Denticeps clupeoides]